MPVQAECSKEAARRLHPFAEPEVDEVAKGQRHEQNSGRPQAEQHESQGNPRPIGAQEGPQPFQSRQAAWWC